LRPLLQGRGRITESIGILVAWQQKLKEQEREEREKGEGEGKEGEKRKGREGEKGKVLTGRFASAN